MGFPWQIKYNLKEKRIQTKPWEEKLSRKEHKRYMEGGKKAKYIYIIGIQKLG